MCANLCTDLCKKEGQTEKNFGRGCRRSFIKFLKKDLTNEVLCDILIVMKVYKNGIEYEVWEAIRKREPFKVFFKKWLKLLWTCTWIMIAMYAFAIVVLYVGSIIFMMFYS